MAYDERIMVVSAVRPDGNVNLDWGGTLVDAGGDGVPALDGYTNRQVGDVVVVGVNDFGMYVKGKFGAGKGSGPVSWKDVRDKPDLSSAGVASVPDPKDLSPNAAVVWQDSYGGWHRTQAVNGGRPIQGAAPGSPLNHGGWFYGSQVSDACSGHTISGMWLDLSRSGSYHGARSTQVYLWLITEGAATSGLPTFGASTAGPVLERGGGTTGYGFKLPASFRDALASGTAKGVGVQGYVSNASYIQFGDCGALHIEFSA